VTTTTRLYEAMILLDNRETKKDFEGLRQRIADVLGRGGGRVVAARKWDERKLAYEIRGQKRATYYIAFFEGPSDSLVGIRRQLYLTEGVMRCLLLAAGSVPEWAFQEPPPESPEGEASEEGAEGAEASSEASDKGEDREKSKATESDEGSEEETVSAGRDREETSE